MAERWNARAENGGGDMTPLEQFCNGHIFVINLAKRPERMRRFEKEMDSIGVTQYVRFEAHEGFVDGKLAGHYGCVASHRGVLELICHNRWPTTVVFEDDAILRDEFRHDFQQRFADMIQQVPKDWDLIYFAAHYADKPIGRITPNIIRAGRVHTTSSYAISYTAARRMAQHIHGHGPVDVLFSGYAEIQKHYVFQPRLLIQSAGWSDLLEQESNSTWAMTDSRHEAMV